MLWEEPFNHTFKKRLFSQVQEKAIINSSIFPSSKVVNQNPQQSSFREIIKFWVFTLILRKTIGYKNALHQLGQLKKFIEET